MPDVALTCDLNQTVNKHPHIRQYNNILIITMKLNLDICNFHSIVMYQVMYVPKIITVEYLQQTRLHQPEKRTPVTSTSGPISGREREGGVVCWQGWLVGLVTGKTTTHLWLYLFPPRCLIISTTLHSRIHCACVQIHCVALLISHVCNNSEIIAFHSFLLIIFQVWSLVYFTWSFPFLYWEIIDSCTECVTLYFHEHFKVLLSRINSFLGVSLSLH